MDDVKARPNGKGVDLPETEVIHRADAPDLAHAID
jgi:hypothetical protein